MTQKSDNQAGREAIARARDILSDFLDDLNSSHNAPGGGPDFRARFKEKVLVIELKSARRRGIDDMRGKLSTAVLQLRKYAANSEYPVAIVHGPKIGRRALASLEEFMNEYAPDVGWGAFDDRGTIRLKLDDIGIDHFEEGSTDTVEARKTTHNKRAFTDLNRWLLKVLMLRDAPEGMWHEGELREPVENPPALSRVAGVSQAKAYQFARTFRDLGWLKWSRDKFQLSHRKRLFDAWYEEEKQLRVETTPTRALFPSAGILDLLEGDTSSLEYAIGGFEACSIHGVLHTASGVPTLHVFGSVELLLRKLELETCAERDAELLLIDMPYEESISRGIIHRYDTPVVDILQAALDVSREPRRGREQADYIIKEVLGWDSWI